MTFILVDQKHYDEDVSGQKRASVPGFSRKSHDATVAGFRQTCLRLCASDYERRLSIAYTLLPLWHARSLPDIGLCRILDTLSTRTDTV